MSKSQTESETEQTVYPSKRGSVYHLTQVCGGTYHGKPMSRSKAERRGLRVCEHCQGRFGGIFT